MAQPFEHPWIPAAASAAVAAFLYLPTVGHGFLWDDPRLLGEALPALSDWRSLLLPPPGVADFDRYYRPLAYGTIWLLDRAGGGGAAPFHWTAVALNAVCAALVALLAYRLLPPAAVRSGGALAAGLWFAVHPVHVEAVAWAGASMNELPTATCLLASLLLYDRARRAGGAGAYALALALAFLALTGKETALALPPLVVALELLAPAAARRDRRRAALRIAGLAVPVAAYLLLRRAALGGWVTAPGAGEGVEPALGAALPAAWFYLERLLLPLRWCVTNFSVPPPGAAGALGLAVIFVGLASLAAWGVRRRLPALPYGAAWVLLALGPPVGLAVYTVATTPLAERYAYVPSIGVALLAAGAVAAAGRRQRIAWGLLLPLAAGFAWLTLERQAVYAGDGSFWAAARRCAPGHCLPALMLADQAMAGGDSAGAALLYRTAFDLACAPAELGLAHAHLGIASFRAGDLVVAEREMRAAAELAPRYSVPRYMLARLAIGRWEQAARAGDESVAHDHLKEARRDLEVAVALRPNEAEYLYALGQVAYLGGDRNEARQRLERALELAPEHEAAASARAILGAMR